MLTAFFCSLLVYKFLKSCVMIYKLAYIKVGNEYLNRLNQIRLQTNRNGRLMKRLIIFQRLAGFHPFQ